MNKLSKRLKAIANFVCDNTQIVDIGCDHGLLDIYLAKNRDNVKIIASDINQNALNNAVINVNKYKLNDIIECRLSDGLDKIGKDEINTIIISGMGAHTIVGILYKGMKKLKNVDNIIVQSNNNMDFLRYKLTKLGYYIIDECLVEDSKIIYTIIKFKKGFRIYSYKKLYFGPILLKKQDSLFKEKCLNDLEKLQTLYKLIPKSHHHHRFITKKKINLYKKIA